MTRDRYVPVPPPLTDPIAPPPAPPKHCQAHGEPAWCILDVLLWTDAWREALDRANVDRKTVRSLSGSAVTP